jgi:flagellin
MGLTVTNTNTLSLLNILNRTTSQQSKTLERLSTGFKINRGSDDPSGLIALQSLTAELTSVDAAIENNQRSDALLGVADGALTEVSSLLTSIESLVAKSTSSSTSTAAEIAANQSQIDAAIDSIDRIIRTTSFNGKKLLDGTFGISTSGVTDTQVTNLKVYSRGNGTSTQSFTVNVTGSATTASFNAASAGAGTLTAATQVSITGSLGTATVTLASGANAASVVASINQSKDLTGVSASVSGANIVLNSTSFGSDEFISVDVLSGGGFTGGGSISETSGKVTGQDATVLVNGQATAVDGLDVNFNGQGYSFSFSLNSSFAQQTATNSVFGIKAEGGATFQLGVDNSTKAILGIEALFSHKIGGGDTGGVLSDLKSGGSGDLNTDTTKALKVVKQAISDVALSRGRIGGFQKFTVQTSINSLTATKEGLTSAKSVIGDTDYAVDTAELNRQQVLLNSAISLLGLANNQTASILSLLG